MRFPFPSLYVMAERDVLSNMFSSFVSRKIKAPSQLPFFPQSSAFPSSSTLPPIPCVPPFPNPPLLSAPQLATTSYTTSNPIPNSYLSSHHHGGASRTHSQSDFGAQFDDGISRDARITQTHTSHVSKSNMTSGAKHKSIEKSQRQRQTAPIEDSIHSVRTGSVEAVATNTTAIAAPFHCDKCPKAFRQRSQLSRHYLRVHERKKPFACAHCNKQFASAFDRKRHVEVSIKS